MDRPRTGTLVVARVVLSLVDRWWPTFTEWNRRRDGVPLLETRHGNALAYRWELADEAAGTRDRRGAYIKSVASVHKTWRERAEFRLDQLFHGRASALRALGILLSMSSNVTRSPRRGIPLYPAPRPDLRALLPRCVPCVSECALPDRRLRRRTRNALVYRPRLRGAADALSRPRARVSYRPRRLTQHASSRPR